jgi:hypothetical protein
MSLGLSLNNLCLWVTWCPGYGLQSMMPIIIEHKLQPGNLSLCELSHVYS